MQIRLFPLSYYQYKEKFDLFQLTEWYRFESYDAEHIHWLFAVRQHAPDINDTELTELFFLTSFSLFIFMLGGGSHDLFLFENIYISQ